MSQLEAKEEHQYQKCLAARCSKVEYIPFQQERDQFGRLISNQIGQAEELDVHKRIQTLTSKYSKVALHKSTEQALRMTESNVKVKIREEYKKSKMQELKFSVE